jgi:hypothetical protein
VAAEKWVNGEWLWRGFADVGGEEGEEIKEVPVLSGWC